MAGSIQDWLDLWKQWLHLWMDCGVGWPSPKAVNRLTKWIKAARDAGWTRAASLGERLLDSAEPPAEKARVFFDLCVMYEAARNRIECDRLKQKYTSAAGINTDD